MRYQSELGIMGNIERIMTELKNQKNKSIITDSNVEEEKSRNEELEEAVLELAEIVGGMSDD